VRNKHCEKLGLGEYPQSGKTCGVETDERGKVAPAGAYCKLHVDLKTTTTTSISNIWQFKTTFHSSNSYYRNFV